MRNPQKAGFTLIELMIVVTILGILSAIALPTYQSYRHRARATEGVHVLSAIGSRQESYFAEFGQYAAVTHAAYPTDWESVAGGFIPDASSVDAAGLTWPSGTHAFQTSLGVKMRGPTYFGYACTAGDPSNPPGAPVSLDADFWWVCAGLADLNGDGDLLTIELTSQSQGVWMSSPRGFD